jgi:hypothetical protein
LATLFNLPLAIAAGWLLWCSLDWPLVGDATIFHFIAGQFQMGAVPYRDIFDVNMPLTYFVHAAVISIGGMGDAAWRAFDLTAAVLVSGLILMLVWPAGRAVAILAVLIVLVSHYLAWALFCRAARLSDVDSRTGGRAGLGQGRRRSRA